MTPPQAPAVSIDVRGLTKSFGGKRVVDDVSMRVSRGEIFFPAPTAAAGPRRSA
jgi:ABC-2 type transport system ATP-binding protein